MRLSPSNFEGVRSLHLTSKAYALFCSAREHSGYRHAHLQLGQPHQCATQLFKIDVITTLLSPQQTDDLGSLKSLHKSSLIKLLIQNFKIQKAVKTFETNKQKH